MASCFWDKIKEILAELDLPDTWLIKKADLKRSTIVQGVKGKSSPSVDIALRCAKALDVSIEYILIGEKETDLTRAEKNLVAKWQCLDAQGQREVIALIDAKLRVYKDDEIPDTPPLGKAAGNP